MLRKQLSYLREGVYVAGTSKMGRGVFTRHIIAAGTTIEIAPVIVMSGEDRLHRRRAEKLCTPGGCQ